MAIKPPLYQKDAVISKVGWKHPRTGELLVCRNFTQEQIDEYNGETAKQESKPAPKLKTKKVKDENVVEESSEQEVTEEEKTEDNSEAHEEESEEVVEAPEETEAENDDNTKS